MDVFSYTLGKKAGGGGTPATLIDKNISANGTYNASQDEADGYKKVVVDVPPTMYPDWTQIGYTEVPQTIISGFNYAKNIYDNWDSTIQNMKDKYYQDKSMLFFPVVDTSNVTDFRNTFQYSGLIQINQINTSNGTMFGNMFYSCESLETAPEMDLSKARTGGTPGYGLQFTFYNCKGLKNVPIYSPASDCSMQSMFQSCPNLTDESLNNIMRTCINKNNNPSVTSGKTLQFIGISSAQATRCQSLSNYDDFIAAGWTTGY